MKLEEGDIFEVVNDGCFHVDITTDLVGRVMKVVSTGSVDHLGCYSDCTVRDVDTGSEYTLTNEDYSVVDFEDYYILQPPEIDETPAEEYTGGSSSYYSVFIANPTTEGRPEYMAECNDIIEALGMNYAEGNAFKALWRRAAARNLGIRKKGYDNGLYDSEKVEFFGKRLIVQSTVQEG